MNLNDALKEVNCENTTSAISTFILNMFNVAVVSRIIKKEERQNVYKICKDVLKAIEIPEKDIDKYINDFELSCQNFEKLLKGKSNP